MATIERRLAAIGVRFAPVSESALLVILQGEPTPEQRAEIEQAQSRGRLVLLVQFIEASVPDPTAA